MTPLRPSTATTIEDPEWLRIDKFRAPGQRDLSQRLIEQVTQTCDVAYAEEWRSTTASRFRCTIAYIAVH